MPETTIVDEPLDNPHRFDSEVHHRLYLDADATPCVVCVQDFDYVDYPANRFLTEDAHPTEDAAERALNELLTARAAAPDFEETARTAHVLAAAGAPLTREQAVDAYLSRGLS